MSSAGVICITPSDKFLLIKRPITYAFGHFVRASYSWSSKADANAETLTALFSLMTSEEKKIIYSLNFQVIWFKQWLLVVETMVISPDHRSTFDRQRDIFHDRFIVRDQGAWLRQCLEAASSVSLLQLYEFPRGKINHGETSLAAAKREFQEETQTLATAYTIINENKPIIHTVQAEDNKKTYTTHYYVAWMHRHPRTHINMTVFGQRAEVDEIYFATIDFLRELNPDLHGLATNAWSLAQEEI